MENRLFVCSSPHLRDNVTTQRLMLDVIIALIPSTVAGILFFGLRAALVIAVTVSASVLTEYLMRKGLKREQTISDLSAVVTGLLLALNLPPSIPLWIAVVGAVIATGLIKQLFGGLGQNFMNPALGARVILVVAWAKHMTTWTEPFVDAVASATPLSLLDATTTATPVEGSVWYSYLDMFLGRYPVVSVKLQHWQFCWDLCTY